MKLTKIGLLAAATLACGAMMAHAADVDELFPNNQLTLDVFGTYDKAFPTFGSQFDNNWRHGAWGGGLGVDFFFDKYIGIGVDSFGEDRGPIFKDVAGSLFLRMPVADSGFAPYIYGGPGGYFNDVNEWTEHAGAGVQFRFTRHIGIFTDWRYTFADKTVNTTLVRAGLQIGF